MGGGNNHLKNNGIQDNETDHQTLSSQKDIEKAYQKLQQILMDTTDAVNNLQGVNTQFDIVKETVAKALEQQITEAKQELSSALKNTTWDNLVIAFKKETNAGKSTIIETLSQTKKRIIMHNQTLLTAPCSASNYVNNLTFGATVRKNPPGHPAQKRNLPKCCTPKSDPMRNLSIFGEKKQINNRNYSL